MAAPVAPNVAQVQMKFLSADGGNMENVFNVFNEGGWSEAALEELAGVVINWDVSDGSDNRSEDVSLIEVVCTDLTSLDASRVAVREALPNAGTQSSPTMPSNVTWAVKAGTSKRGRGRQGRLFWIGLAENMVIGNQIDPTFAASIITALDNLIVAINGMTGSPDLVVLHHVRDGVVLDPMTHDVVIGWTYADLTIDSQRDRLPNHKAHRVS